MIFLDVAIAILFLLFAMMAAIFFCVPIRVSGFPDRIM